MSIPDIHGEVLPSDIIEELRKRGKREHQGSNQDPQIHAVMQEVYGEISAEIGGVVDSIGGRHMGESEVNIHGDL